MPLGLYRTNSMGFQKWQLHRFLHCLQQMLEHTLTFAQLSTPLNALYARNKTFTVFGTRLFFGWLDIDLSILSKHPAHLWSSVVVHVEDSSSNKWSCYAMIRLLESAIERWLHRKTRSSSIVKLFTLHFRFKPNIERNIVNRHTHPNSPHCNAKCWQMNTANIGGENPRIPNH